MEAQLVETVRFGDVDDALPLDQVGGRVAGAREYAALEGAADEDRTVVDRQARAAYPNLAQTEGQIAVIVQRAGLQGNFQAVKRGCEFVPGLCLWAEWVNHFQLGLAGLDLDRHRQRASLVGDRGVIGGGLEGQAGGAIVA